MKVYVIRHGESENNLKGLWTGWQDVPLTEKGQEDAQKAGDFLKQVSFDKIYTSDLVRAMKTAEIAVPGCSYEASPLLREINVGTLANQPYSVLTEQQRERISRQGYAEFSGETYTDFYGRIHALRKELEALACETVALFSHAGWLRGMLDTVLDMHVPRKNVCCNNCVIGIFEYANDVWKLHSWINLT
jgi:broad specificity phosphatase PhoE